MSDSALRLAHVGIAVSRIADALPFYRDVLGVTPGPPEEADGATIVSLHLGDVAIELLEPRDPDSPIARFLPAAAPGSTTSAIASRISTARSSAVVPRATGSSTPRRATAPPVAGSPSSIRRRRRGSCSS